MASSSLIESRGFKASLAADAYFFNPISWKPPAARSPVFAVSICFWTFRVWLMKFKEFRCHIINNSSQTKKEKQNES